MQVKKRKIKGTRDERNLDMPIYEELCDFTDGGRKKDKNKEGWKSEKKDQGKKIKKKIAKNSYYENLIQIGR